MHGNPAISAIMFGAYGLRESSTSVMAEVRSTPLNLSLIHIFSASEAADGSAYAAACPGRVRLVTGGRNVGWRANYRRTFDACRGKYVAYCDGDDWWTDPCKLQMQADLMESDPGCGMCRCV